MIYTPGVFSLSSHSSSNVESLSGSDHDFLVNLSGSIILTLRLTESLVEKIRRLATGPPQRGKIIQPGVDAQRLRRDSVTTSTTLKGLHPIIAVPAPTPSGLMVLLPA